jgi:threonine dehydratase
VALAAVLSGRIDCRGRTIGVIASGGNCDAETFSAILRREI